MDDSTDEEEDPEEDSEDPDIDPALVEKHSVLRGAIPVLPIHLAMICFVANVFLPGLGESQVPAQGYGQRERPQMESVLSYGIMHVGMLLKAIPVILTNLPSE
jgi:hypothetical protein